MSDSDAAEIFSVDFIESTILTDEEDTGGATRPSKKPQTQEDSFHHALRKEDPPLVSSSTIFSNIPTDVIHHILRFLSPQDLVSCSIVCKFLCHAASDESLWRRLCCMRWGSNSASSKPSENTWKKLYFERDGEDMSKYFSNRPTDLHKYFFQMQVAIRSQAPPSQINDDHIIHDITFANQLSDWISSRGFTDESDEPMTEHICGGRTCTYSLNRDIYICVKTGRVHVCGESQCDALGKPRRGFLTCPISFQYFAIWLSKDEDENRLF